MLAFAILIFIWISLWILFVIALLIRRQVLRKRLAKEHRIFRRPALLAFFHPYCNSGGGGERVLWTGVDCLLRTYPSILIFIYTNDTTCLNSPIRVFQRVHETFDIPVQDVERVIFVRLRSEPLLRANLYPFLTLAGQAFGSLVAAVECLIRLPPDFFIDTTGIVLLLTYLSGIILCHLPCRVNKQFWW